MLPCWGIVNLTKISNIHLSSEPKGASLEGSNPGVHESTYKALFFLFLHQCINFGIKLTMPAGLLVLTQALGPTRLPRCVRPPPRRRMRIQGCGVRRAR